VGLRVSIDSNIFIAIKNEESNQNECELILNSIEQYHWECILSTVQVAEILVGYYQNHEDDDAEEFLSKIQHKYTIYPVDLDISKEAAQLRAEYKIKLPDALIVATAIQNAADVIISNDIPLIKKMPIKVLKSKEFIATYLGSA
jgi:predicted nucleic acid-binding protein